MLNNGQTYSENLAVPHTTRLLKYVWPFFNIINETVNIFQILVIVLQPIQLFYDKGYFCYHKN